MIKYLLLPFVFLIALSFESLFVSFLPNFGLQSSGILVPHFLLIVLTFSSVYLRRNLTLVYAAVFGLLFDVAFTNLLGVYTFLFPLTIYLISILMRALHQTIPIVTGVTLLGIGFIEFMVYGIMKLVQQSHMSFDSFFIQRFCPTLFTNFIFIVLFGYIIKLGFKKIHDYIEEVEYGA